MNFEPEKFFVGMMEFFTILLPGALVTYLLKDPVINWLLKDDEIRCLKGFEGWAVFLFCSYLLGHFIFLIGSRLLDDQIYDRIRESTYAGKIRRLAAGKKPHWILFDWLAGILIKTRPDKALGRVLRIRNHYLGPLKASPAINAFQWSKARLTLENPEAMTTVQRFEADSKFFRSFSMALCFIILWTIFKPGDFYVHRDTILIACVILLLLAFLRYVDQRLKSTNQAYWYVITLEGQRKDGYRHRPYDPGDGPSHAGGVVYRKVRGHIEYLLVRAKLKPEESVLPKGHIEPGEEMPETAVREVREETGTWARVMRELEDVPMTAGGKDIKTRFYLMDAVRTGERTKEKREHKWLAYDKAVKEATYEDTKKLLKFAEQCLKDSRDGK